MAFGGQMHDRVGLMRVEHAVKRFAVADIDMLETVIRIVRDRRHILETGGIGQRIEVHDLMAVAHGLAYHGGPDKPRPAGDDQFHWPAPS